MGRNKSKRKEIPELNSNKAFEILVNVFKACDVEIPDSCHRYFENSEGEEADEK